MVRLHVRSVQLPGGGEDSARASALQENSATVQVALSVCHIWFVLQGGGVEVAELCIVSSKLKTHHEYCSTGLL